MDNTIQVISLSKFLIYSFSISISAIIIFIVFFRDLFFRTSFKYTIEKFAVPEKKNILPFIKYPRHSENNYFFLTKWWNNKYYKNKIVIVAGESTPEIYDEEFYEKTKSVSNAGVSILMIAGPIFLVEDGKEDSYALRAGRDKFINLYVAKHRLKNHYRANLLTGELYFEYQHEPCATHRTSVHFKENRFEVKHYLRKANRLIKRAKPFENCKENEDYLLLCKKELELVKQCVEAHGKQDFDKYTVEDFKELISECRDDKIKNLKGRIKKCV